MSEQQAKVTFTASLIELGFLMDSGVTIQRNINEFIITNIIGIPTNRDVIREARSIMKRRYLRNVR